MRQVTRAALVLSAMLLPDARGARADNFVTVRGQYYREPSTRVIQPVVHIGSDMPGGVDVSAHYLLDAITSASAAAGPDGDNIFTEYRSESGLSIGKSWSRLRIGAAYKYSAESDYWSHMVALSAALRLWADTATLALSTGFGHDEVGRRPRPTGPTVGCVPSGPVTCPLNTVFGGIGYSQVFSPTLVVQAGYEFVVMNGFLASPYRVETVPNNRVRQALSARGAKYFPQTRTGIQLQYRYYWDIKWDRSDALLVVRSLAVDDASNPWQVRSHTVEARLFQGVGRDVELRLTGRYYSQTPANFWCENGNPGCHPGSQLTSSDPKLEDSSTVFVEGKVYWQAARWRDKPFFGWFSGGTFELSYGRFFQSTAFANAHLLQTGYSLPFN